MTWVLVRTDQGGGYVAPAGSPGSYTHNVAAARKWSTKEDAEGDRCPGNEIAVDVDEIMGRA